MIELFYADTPNGRKISIMLEEIKFNYKLTEIDLSKGDQFNSDFRKISPLSKIPAITDHKNKVSLFQSGAILIYLAELNVILTIWLYFGSRYYLVTHSRVV